MKIDEDTPENVEALLNALSESFALITPVIFVGHRVFGADFQEVRGVIGKYMEQLYDGMEGKDDS